MNGRVYDYNLGRFLSVDPFIQDPGNSQSMNPYSYIMNNPLAGTDPTGYLSVKMQKKTGSRIQRKVDVKVAKTGNGSFTVSVSGGSKSENKAGALAIASKAQSLDSSATVDIGSSSSTNGQSGGGTTASTGESSDSIGDTKNRDINDSSGVYTKKSKEDSLEYYKSLEKVKLGTKTKISTYVGTENITEIDADTINIRGAVSKSVKLISEWITENGVPYNLNEIPKVWVILDGATKRLNRETNKMEDVPVASFGPAPKGITNRGGRTLRVYRAAFKGQSGKALMRDMIITVGHEIAHGFMRLSSAQDHRRVEAFGQALADELGYSK
jgi:hypothetical protein